MVDHWRYRTGISGNVENVRMVPLLMLMAASFDRSGVVEKHKSTLNQWLNRTETRARFNNNNNLCPCTYSVAVPVGIYMEVDGSRTDWNGINESRTRNPLACWSGWESVVRICTWFLYVSIVYDTCSKKKQTV